MHRLKNRKIRFLWSFLFLFITSSIAAFLVYYGIKLLKIGNNYDAPIRISDGYHGGYLSLVSEHPFPFLISISLILAISGTIWVVSILPKFQRFQFFQTLLIPWISLIIASPIWGLIWSIYQYPPKGFSDSTLMWMYYRHDALFGLRLGWLSALLSFPINIIGYVFAVGLIYLSSRIFVMKTPGL